jgi:hypothetical protein
MKTNLKQLFLIGASSFWLAGCCATHHVTQWEYKVVTAPELAGTMGQPNQEVARQRRANEQEFLNELGKDGWMMVSEDSGIFYLRRPLK